MNFVFVLLLNVVRVYKYAILARVLVSWIQVNPHNRVVIFLYQLTEPVLRFFRRLLPRFGMIDLSPLIAFIALDFIQLGLIRLMMDLM
jgi:YggT family protein